MKILKIIIILVVLFLFSCASTSNVTKFGDDYYSEFLTKSKNVKNLKAYLKENNIKLGALVYRSNLPNGGLGSIVLGGKLYDFTSKEQNDWIKTVIVNLPNTELSGLYLEGAGYTLTYCADFTHAYIAEDAISGSMDYTYFLTKMTENDRQSYLKSKGMLSDCAIDGMLGSVFYKKKIHVISNKLSAKITIVRTDKSKQLSPQDNLKLLIKDMADQAMTEMLNDGEMLQALKDIRLVNDKSFNITALSFTSPRMQEHDRPNQSLPQVNTPDVRHLPNPTTGKLE